MSQEREEADTRVREMILSLRHRRVEEFRYPRDAGPYLAGGKLALYEVMRTSVFAEMRPMIDVLRSENYLVHPDETGRPKRVGNLADVPGTANRFHALQSVFEYTYRQVIDDVVHSQAVSAEIGLLTDAYARLARTGVRGPTSNPVDAVRGGIHDATTDFATFFAAVPHILLRDGYVADPRQVAEESFFTVHVPRIKMSLYREAELSKILGEYVDDDRKYMRLSSNRIMNIEHYRTHYDETRERPYIRPIKAYEDMVDANKPSLFRRLGQVANPAYYFNREPAVGCPAGVHLIMELQDWMLDVADEQNVWEDSARLTS